MTKPLWRFLALSPFLTRPEAIRYVVSAVKELADIMGIDLKEVGVNA